MANSVFIEDEIFLVQSESVCGPMTLLHLTDRAMDTTVHMVPTEWWGSNEIKLTHDGLTYRKTGDENEPISDSLPID